ncbi:MAG: hypothetical protein PVG39_27025 [Desulfobacteraceae bacterium]|jgi:hypothetical protein
MTYGKGHSEYSQPKGQSNAKKADTNIRERGGYNGAAATAKLKITGMRCLPLKII